MSKVDIDELVHWRDTCEALAASLQRKVRHCDEITEERDKALRERDEDRETANRLRMFYTGCELDRRRLADELAIAIAQRDETRAEIAGLPAWQKGCEQALADLADAEEAIARLYTERDEARAEVGTWKHDWYVAKADLGTAMRLADVALRDVAEKYERALRERDEAREEVEQLRYKAIQYDLDRAGIESRAQEAVALVEARAEVQEYREQLRKLPDANRVASQDAYRRGAEAMRFACQQWCRAWENDGDAIADALADLRVEGKP